MNELDMKQASKLINAAPNKLRAALVEQGVFTQNKKTRERLPKLEYIEQGYFKTQLTQFKKSDVDHLVTKVVVTAKGVEYLREFIANNVVARVA